MKSEFPLFQSHIDLAHSYWKKLLQKGDVAIDATCGNGQDTLILATYCLSADIGTLYAFDILDKAIELTRKNLQKILSNDILQRVHLIQGSHSKFPEEIRSESVKLIVYNLGYLPGGGNKSQTTQAETTLESLKASLKLVMPGGVISITLYPGHPEGQREENMILSFAKNLDPFVWNCCHHQWINRKKSPSLLILQKKISKT